MASKSKFIQALFCIDFALFLIIVDHYPIHETVAGGGFITYTDNPWHIFRLTSAVVLATLGVFLIVNNFYKWPTKSE